MNQYIIYENKKAVFVFSTAEDNLNFNKKLNEGIENIESLKNKFNLKSVGYLNQIHSDKVYIYDGKVHDGDAIITDEKDIAVGVFTADCVPILIYDTSNNVIAAVHSGWRGTLNCIVSKTLMTMKDKYNTDYKNVIVYIGPHIRQCCYEVGNEVVDLFKKSKNYNMMDFNNMLNLEKCIVKQLLDLYIDEKNIKIIDECTFCSNKYKFHSYRRQKETYGRMFSFIFLKN